MGAVIGLLLPLAVALAAGPLQLIALVLILVSEDARAKGVAFVGGRLLGLAVIVGATCAIVSVIGGDQHTHRGPPSTASSVVRIIVGIVLLVLAVRNWRSRPKPGDTPRPSRLSRRIDALNRTRAFGLGLALSVLEPSSVSLGILAGLDIASPHLPSTQAVILAIVFVLAATITTTLPLLGYLVGGTAAQQPLAAARQWLTTNEKTVMMVLLLIVGAMLVGRGITDLAG